MKEWKYRFKRGLASFLTVGMIASGVNAAVCLPVYAVETTEETAVAETFDELQKAVSLGLKEQILGIFEENSTQTEAQFDVSVEFKDQNTETDKTCNTKWKERIEKSAPQILEGLLKECPLELFWYDPAGKVNGESSYSCNGGFEGYDQDRNVVEAKFTFLLAVKDDFISEDGTLNVEKIKEFKKSVDDILNDQDDESADYFILQTYREAACAYETVSPGEGSNIFQSLCNNTMDFKSGTVCYTVRGTRVQEGKSEEYTWNIVGIQRKTLGSAAMYYYLVDIAECAAGKDAEYFLVGAQKAQQDGYTIANGTTYIPNEGSPSFNMSGLKYKQDQDDFRFVKPEVKFDGMGITRVLGEKDIIVEVAGNVYSNISFTSTNQKVATIDSDQTSPYQAQIHMKNPGITEIWARAYETDSHALREIRFTLSVSEKEGTQPPTQDPENPGNNGGNGNQTPTVPDTPGYGGGGGGAIGGGSSSGGSGGNGSVGTATTTALGLELIAQTDFTFDVGYAKILKTIGAPDFTITAGGQVAGSEVTYESSDTSVASVNAKTGEVHIVGQGNAKIIATASATDIHKEATCEYKLEVVKEEGNIYN